MSLLSTLQALEAARTRVDPGGGEVIDYSFELGGEALPVDYLPALESAVVAMLPWVKDDLFFGIHPVNAPLTNMGYMLSRRSRLQLRTFSSHAAELSALTGKELALGTLSIVLGAMTCRPVTPFPTLRAQMVVNPLEDELAFMDDIGMQLEILAVKAGAICGKASSVQGAFRRLEGFALVLHDLSPVHSMRLQTVGMGAARRLGCGLFVHHKIIEGPDAWPE